MILKEINVYTVLGEDHSSPIDQERVASLAESIKVGGLLCPIGVRKSGFANAMYRITYGRHRLAAFKLLGRGTIPCVVFDVNEDLDVDDIYAELAMIDENLIRGVMSPAQKASATARRKVLYLELHPETAAGEAQGEAGLRARGLAEDSSVSPSFTEATAAATGVTSRTVRTNAARGAAMVTAGIDAQSITGTSLDSGAEIDALVALPADDREELVAAAVAGQSVSARAPRVTTPTIVLDASEYTVEPPVDPETELRLKCKAVIDGLSGEKLTAVVARLEAVKRAADLLAEADPLSIPLYVGTTTADQVNALRRCVTDPLLHIGPLFIEFVKEHSLEVESITSLHDALITMETMYQEMLDAVVGAYDAQFDAREAADPVEVEVVAGIEPAEKCTVTGCDGGRLFEDGIEVSLCGVCHPEAYADEVVEPVVVKAKPAKVKLDFVVTRPAPKNKRSRIYEGKKATPESVALYAASHGLGVAA
jgi:ParB-like nuclease domain